MKKFYNSIAQVGREHENTSLTLRDTTFSNNTILYEESNATLCFYLQLTPLFYIYCFYPCHWHLISSGQIFDIIYLQSTPNPIEWQIIYLLSMTLIIYFIDLESFNFLVLVITQKLGTIDEEKSFLPDWKWEYMCLINKMQCHSV